MAELRPATAHDVGAVLDFWKVATTVASSTDDVASVTALVERVPGALIVATEGSAIVGTIIGGWDGWRGTMYRLAVAPEHRRRGIATRLVEAAEAFVVARGARRLHLIVADDEPEAVAFWASAGYTATSQTRFVKTLGSDAR